MNRLYHITCEEFIDAIRREGLHPNEHGEPVHLADADGAFSGEFLAQTNEWTTPAVTLEVDVTGLVLGEGWDGGGTYTYTGVIPPERLREVPESAIYEGEA